MRNPLAQLLSIFTRRRHLCLAAGGIAPLALSGCELAPSVNVLGSFFPAWMFCILGALLGALVIHRILSALGWLGYFTPRPVAFAALWTMLALCGWLWFFQN